MPKPTIYFFCPDLAHFSPSAEAQATPLPPQFACPHPQMLLNSFSATSVLAAETGVSDESHRKKERFHSRRTPRRNRHHRPPHCDTSSRPQLRARARSSSQVCQQPSTARDGNEDVRHRQQEPISPHGLHSRWSVGAVLYWLWCRGSV